MKLLKEFIKESLENSIISDVQENTEILAEQNKIEETTNSTNNELID